MLEEYHLLPNLLIRTPLLPIDILFSKESIDRKLEEIYSDKTIQEAIYIASPDLYYLLLKWIDNIGSSLPIQNQRMEETLLKYLTRMSSRCTPFGLFAGCSLGKWGESTSILIENFKNNKKNVRFDMMLLNYLTNILAKNDIIKYHLKYYPNSSLYEFSNNYRYFEAIYSSSQVDFNLSEVGKNHYLSKVISSSANGLNINEISKCIEDNHLNILEANEFILDLIENQVLISELEPIITGDKYLTRLESIICRIKGEILELPKEVDTIYNIIREANLVFGKISNNFSGSDVLIYEKIYSNIKKVVPEIDQKFIFQVDLIKKHINNVVTNKLAGQIRKAIEILNILFPSKKNDKFYEFRQEFFRRFEYAEIPLLQALDNESGIGYPISSDENSYIIPIVDDILVHNINVENISNNIPVHKWLQNKYLNAIAEGQIEIRLNDEELKLLAENKEQNNFPDTISAIGSFFQDQNDHTEKIFLRIAGCFASAASILGRYTLYDPDIDTFVKEITQHEQEVNAGKILAEIVHLSQSRIGNVLTRSHIRDFEIPILTKSTLPEKHIIRISDLNVSISKNLERIILKSKKLNKEIIPRLSTAHNTNTGNQLPIYSFLADIQYQGYRNPLIFTWETTGIFYPFKPRVVYKNVILHKAGWAFESKELQFIKANTLKGDFYDIRQWREHWKIPQYVVVREDDNELLLDLEEIISLQMFSKIIGRSDQIFLDEFLYKPKSCVVEDKEGGKYTNEFVMTFAKDINNSKVIENKGIVENNENINKCKRNFIVGSEWIYFKIYLGFKTADEILFSFNNLIIKNKQRGIVLHWFFIHYSDPKYHLRIRIKLSNRKYIGIILLEVNKIFNPKLNAGKISSIQIDTYKREIERYGMDAIDLVEKYFEHQSIIIIEFLKSTKKVQNQDLIRFAFAIKIFNLYLDEFDYNTSEKKEFVYKSLSSFETELNISSITKKKITLKYQFLEPMLDSLLVETSSIDVENWNLVSKILKNYTNTQSKLIKDIKRKSSLYKNLSSRYDFVWSLNHMFINKLIGIKSRKFEYILYAILNKHLNKLHYSNLSI